MKTTKYVMLLAAVALAIIALPLANLAQAATVSYTAGGVAPTQFSGPNLPAPTNAPHVLDGEGYAGDSVGLASYADSLPLIPGTYTQQIDTLTWSVSYTYNSPTGYIGTTNPGPADWPELDFPITLTRTLSFGGGPVGSISQTGMLRSTWDDDYLSLDAGGTSTFFVPGFQIDVMPLGLPETSVSSIPGFPLGTPWQQPDRAVMAQFVVTAVPEPTTLVLGLVGFAGLGLVNLRKKFRQA